MTIEIREPELEALIRERLESGAYQNVEDLLMQALKSSPSNEQMNVSRHKPKQNLAQFLLNSPLRDSGLQLERRQDYPRPIAL
jgi:Arc/MetJ-type ribon-helix-helix transcriptional regulator